MAKRRGIGSGSLVKRGSIVTVELPHSQTHEQAGRRPCVVVSNEASVINARYDMIVVVPLTTTMLSGNLYPTIKKGDANLKMDSVAPTDQIRSIDKSRVEKVGLQLSQAAINNIDNAIRYLLGYDH